MERKWFYSSWFIALMFVLWPTVITLLVGALLLWKRDRDERKTLEQYRTANNVLKESVTDLKKKLETQEKVSRQLAQEAVELEDRLSGRED